MFCKLFSKACASGWIENVPKIYIKSGVLEDSILQMKHYLLRKHGDVTWADIQYLGITQKVMVEHMVAATMDKANLHSCKKYLFCMHYECQIAMHNVCKVNMVCIMYS